MAIAYLPSDPVAGKPEPCVVNPLPNRPSNRAGYTLFGIPEEEIYAPGTRAFMFWQCREAALRAIQTWEELHGTFRRWQGNRRTLRLLPDTGQQLTAFYNRSSLSFFHFAHTNGMTTYSGASTDAVVHEVGHACLDAIRPDLWHSMFFEVNAFHEAFGDCLAILHALRDREIATRLLHEDANLQRTNFVEATLEGLAEGVRTALGSEHPASQPRHCFNIFRWAPPFSLPVHGGPADLMREVHSFGRVFTGCFYDTLVHVFELQPQQNVDGLQEAARLTGRVLLDGAENAPEGHHFFQAVGLGMATAAAEALGQDGAQAVRSAFRAHGIEIGQSGQVVHALHATAPRATVRGVLASHTRAALFRALGEQHEPRLHIENNSFLGANREVFTAAYRRDVPLDALGPGFEGVVAPCAVTTVIATDGQTAVALGDLPTVPAMTAEVLGYVHVLRDAGCIRFDANSRHTPVVGEPGFTIPTHAIRKVGAKKVLRRMGFV